MDYNKSPATPSAIIAFMLLALLKTMRPRQWVKNAFVFTALVFDGKLFIPEYFVFTLAAFGLLCLLASTVYIVNDLADIEKDRQHPAKRNRPLAAGALSKNVAILAAILFILIALGGGFRLGFYFGALALLYFILNLLYSFWLKHVVILDVLIVSAGFVIRVASGTVLFHVERFSPWLYVGMSLLSLFLILGKRRHEINLLQGDAEDHRAVLANYNLDLLDHMIGIVTTSAIVAYSFYTFTAENLPQNHTMMLTIPFVLYGIFRYLYLIHVRHQGGAPDELLFKDRPLLMAVGLWSLTVILLLYFIK
ncbi:MAG TPA: decaprenyl-phosphate phosphoribosyltransferase [Anaerolineales bacterium]|nr:decaprenyl-phosphate phosphoribosyltransferase [Anaerolineales bacterium]